MAPRRPEDARMGESARPDNEELDNESPGFSPPHNPRTSRNATSRKRNALLEDLQTTVSRSNSTTGSNGQVTGYRSFRRTVTDGTPEGTSTEYQVEYLNPANSTTQMIESSYNNSASNFKNEKHNKYRAVTSSSSSSDAKMKQNISELDSLLDDLNAAQKKNFSSSVVSTSRNHSGIDSGLLEPSASSTPAGSKLIQKLYREEKTTTSMRGRSPSPRGRELVFTGTRSRDPSPVPLDFHTSFETREETPNVQQVYRYEKTTTSRTTAPVVTTEYPSPYSTTNTITYGEEPLAIKDRSPSPINRHHNSSSSSYYNSTSRDTTSHHDRVGYPRDHEPDSTPRYGTTKTAYSYSSNSTRESRSESRAPPPPPHRSPSPVSFNQPPLPGSKNSRSYADSSPPPTRRSQSPHQFSPSDPTHNKLTYNVSPPHGSHMYKYTSTTTTSSNAYHDQPHNNLKPRPFPTSPGEQQPPKKLDELLATLSDGSVSPSSPPAHDKYSETNVHRYTSHHTSSSHHSSNGYPGRNVGNGHPPGSPSTPEHTKTVTIAEQTDLKEREAEKEKLIEKSESKGSAGPPVYYPPGVELFTKKEESMMQKQEGGSKYKAMAKYEYEAKSKSKHTESSGKAVVPVCLPVCCAMPCSIM